jgi:predicted ATPase
LYLGYVAKAYADLNQRDDASRYIEEAITVIETTGQSLWAAEVNRLAGEIALQSQEPDKAQRSFERSLEIARKQQAKSLELRVAMSMARHWRDQGNRKQACGLLAPIYGWFAEGFDTRDLNEAKALLQELTT